MNFKKSLMVALALSLTSQSALAETWVVFPNQNLSSRQTEEKIEEFKKLHPNKIIISAYEGLSHEDIGAKKIMQLKNLFEKAEEAFFANNFAQSKMLHAQFSEAILQTHFRGAIKNHLIRSLIRQSQMQSDPAIISTLMNRAISMGPNFLPQRFGFSPSVLDMWNKYKNLGSKKSFPLHLQLPSNGIVFLDGQRTEFTGSEKTYFIKEGFHHLAVLMPNSGWVVKTINVTAPTTEAIQSLPLVTGTCENPTFLGEELPKGIEGAAYFENGCATVFGGGPVKLSPSFEPEIKNELAQEFSKPPSAFEKTIKSPWLWVVVGTVVAGFLIHQSQNENGRVIPVHTNN